MSWLEEIYSRVKFNEPDKALDILFGKFDELFRDAKFDEANDILEQIDLEKLDTNLLVGILTITLAAKSSLPNRPNICKKIEERLKYLAKDRVDRLMKGLV